MKKVISLMGARPQFIKEAVVRREARRRRAWRHTVVHSGQHYDANMSDIFFQEAENLKNEGVTEDVSIPLGYLGLMSLTQHYAAAVTDSGGCQKEVYYAGKRAVVAMPETGWRELTKVGWNILCSPDAKHLAHTITTALEAAHFPENPFGKGKAGGEIISDILLHSYHG